MLAEEASGASRGAFYQDDEEILRSVGVGPSGLKSAGAGPAFFDSAALLQTGQRKHAPVYRSAASGPVFDMRSMPAHLQPVGLPKRSHGMPSDMSAVANANSVMLTKSSINPPMLPSPPYPLERHSYGLNARTPDEVFTQVDTALKATLIDSDHIESECRWDCTVVSSGKHVRFHVRLHRAAEAFCVEFQRRKGCSIVFNMAVSGVLKHIGQARERENLKPVVLFQRSEADMKVAPSKGFFVESFDIPDVPLDLSFSLLDTDDTGAAAADVATVQAAKAERQVSDGVQVLLDMAASPLEDMAVEGTAGLAILSKPEGREALLAPARVPGVAKATAAALDSNNTSVRVAGATLLANLSEDQRSHKALVESGSLDKAIAVAQNPHTGATAHIRRECLRALVHFCGGPNSQDVVIKGGRACCAAAQAACHSDVRMRVSVDRLRAALGGK